jgi:hypothetical protein
LEAFFISLVSHAEHVFGRWCAATASLICDKILGKKILIKTIAAKIAGINHNSFILGVYLAIEVEIKNLLDA